MSGNESGQERFRESRKDLEFASDGNVLKPGCVLGGESLGLGVDGQSVSLADLGTGQLNTSASPLSGVPGVCIPWHRNSLGARQAQ